MEMLYRGLRFVRRLYQRKEELHHLVWLTFCPRIHLCRPIHPFIPSSSCSICSSSKSFTDSRGVSEICESAHILDIQLNATLCPHVHKERAADINQSVPPLWVDSGQDIMGCLPCMTMSLWASALSKVGRKSACLCVRMRHEEIYDSVKMREFYPFDSWQGDRSACPVHHSANESKKDIIIYQIMIISFIKDFLFLGSQTFFPASMCVFVRDHTVMMQFFSIEQSLSECRHNGAQWATGLPLTHCLCSSGPWSVEAIDWCLRRQRFQRTDDT